MRPRKLHSSVRPHSNLESLLLNCVLILLSLSLVVCVISDKDDTVSSGKIISVPLEMGELTDSSPLHTALLFPVCDN